MRVYFAKLHKPLPDFKFQRYLEQMPPDIQQKIRHYKNWEDAHTSLVGKILLIQGLQDIGLSKIDLSVLRYNQYDRPFIPGSIDFNISHSDTLVSCAINTSGSIGIDVERIKPINKADFYDCWTPRETMEIYRDPKNHEIFYSYWTKKEAVVKAIGNGLNIPLKNIEINTDHAVVTNHGNWYFKEISLCKEYVSHIVTKEPYCLPVVLIQKHFM